jgi:hypothetical protein
MKRRYIGFAGHLIVAEYCRFHIATEIGDVLVSTVGAYQPPGHKRGEWETIGVARLYETMVFRLGTSFCSCGCGAREVESWSEIDFAGYNDVRAAEDGHEAMCQKYETEAVAASTA